MPERLRRGRLPISRMGRGRGGDGGREGKIDRQTRRSTQRERREKEGDRQTNSCLDLIRAFFICSLICFAKEKEMGWEREGAGRGDKEK